MENRKPETETQNLRQEAGDGEHETGFDAELSSFTRRVSLIRPAKTCLLDRSVKMSAHPWLVQLLILGVRK